MNIAVQMRLQADVHKINHAGQSPLHFAAASASLQVTSLLLDHDSVSNQVLGVFMGNHWMSDWIDTWEHCKYGAESSRRWRMSMGLALCI